MQREPRFRAQQGRGFRRGAPGMALRWRIYSGREESTLIDDVLILNESPLLGGRQSSQSPRYRQNPHEQRARNSFNRRRWSGNMMADEVVILDDGSAGLHGAADLIRRRSHLLPGMRPPEGGQQTRVASSGLTEEMALLLLRPRKYVPSSTACANDETCCICQEDYAKGEDLGMLSCGHGFHVACIGRWLTQRNVCPICRKTAVLPAV